MSEIRQFMLRFRPLSPKNGSHIDLNSVFLKNLANLLFFAGPCCMELLLNLAWLLLIVPAFCLWWGSRMAREKRSFSALQALLALGCVLVMLFPVISATDDLLAMRAEIEESPASKRSVRQATADKASASNLKLQTPPALLSQAESFNFSPEFFEQQSRPPALRAIVLVRRVGRAPPAVDLV